MTEQTVTVTERPTNVEAATITQEVMATKEPVSQQVPKDEQPKTEAPQDDVSARIAAISKRQRMLESSNKRLMADYESAQKKLADYESRFNGINEGKKNPKKLLETLGITYDDVIKAGLSEEYEKQPEHQIKTVQQELAEIKKWKEERENRDREESDKRNIDALKYEVSQHIKGNAEKYEFINTYNAVDAVIDVMSAYYKNNNEMLELDEACKSVEDYYESELKKVSGNKKFKKLFGEHIEESSTDKKELPNTQTLTNASTTSQPIIPKEINNIDARMEYLLKKHGATAKNTSF